MAGHSSEVGAAGNAVGARTFALMEIAALVGAVAPNGSAAHLRIGGVGSLVDAEPDQLSFLAAESYVKDFSQTRAAAVLVHKKINLPAKPGANGPILLVVDNAELAMSKVLELFNRPAAKPPAGIDSHARIDPSASIDPQASVGPFTSIGARSRIGRGTVIRSQVFIGDDVVIGEDCEIHPNVTIRERITIGSRVIVHAGSVLGKEGFGFRWDGGKHARVPQIGTVIIEDDVEIGACCCIDRAKFSATRVGRGTKIDNLVQIAHNVVIGPNCILVGQCGLAGSAVLGANVTLGGQVAVRDHITLGDGSMVAACGAVADDVPPKAIVSGMPALPHRQSLREQAAIRRLPDVVVQLRKMQEEIERLKGNRPPADSRE